MLCNGDANGIWTLKVIDSAALDGGTLNNWSLIIKEPKVRRSDYSIQVNFTGGLSATQKMVFQEAGKRWSEVILNDFTLDIDAGGEAIDGSGQVLGMAGPTSVSPGTLFPDRGKLPLCRLTIAMLEDLGYTVDYEAADPYILPNRRMLVSMLAENEKQKRQVVRPVCEGLAQTR